MTNLPSIYSALSKEAERAYGDWMIALWWSCEHVTLCRLGCDDQMMRCPDGMMAAENERRAWRAWHAARTANREVSDAG